jgi:dTMP kinase
MSTEPPKPVAGGALIAFEGIDGAGKTTQALAVRDALTAGGYDAIYLREPTDGQYGRRLREIMVSGREDVSPMQEFELFRDDRREDVRLNIAPALQRGAIVCLDRYYISSMAYQGALGLDPEFIRVENEKIAPRPDLVLYFWLPVEESVARIRASRREGQNLFEVQHYQQKVFDILESMTEPPLVKIDARRPVDEVTAAALARIQALLREKPKGKPAPVKS